VSDGSGLAEALLGMPGFRVLENQTELVMTIESTATIVGCLGCGVVAEPHDRMPVEIRDLPCFERPARLVWKKRRWRCPEPEWPPRPGQSSPRTCRSVPVVRQSGCPSMPPGRR
jgi:hypothetical protein